MSSCFRLFVAAAALAAPFVPIASEAQGQPSSAKTPAPAVVQAGGEASLPQQGGFGDLLVAPTRLVLDGRQSAEVILNNIGQEPATYRISVEFRRMTPDGGLEDVSAPNEREKLAEQMIVYAPRRVTLAPREPQSIRVAARPPAGLPDGEYRVHMLFRAIPPSTPVAASASAAPQKSISFNLIPVYGVTIPVIVRLGNLQVKSSIENPQLETRDGKRSIAFDLTRSGDRSTFGEVRVLKAGVKDPIAVQRAVAVYTEVGKRRVSVPLDERFTGDPRGPVTIQYVETFDDGSNTLAETKAVLR
jgi:P pilus assembly chaperone PapD